MRKNDQSHRFFYQRFAYVVNITYELCVSDNWSQGIYEKKTDAVLNHANRVSLLHRQIGTMKFTTRKCLVFSAIMFIIVLSILIRVNQKEAFWITECRAKTIGNEIRGICKRMQAETFYFPMLSSVDGNYSLKTV